MAVTLSLRAILICILTCLGILVETGLKLLIDTRIAQCESRQSSSKPWVRSCYSLTPKSLIFFFKTLFLAFYSLNLILKFLHFPSILLLFNEPCCTVFFNLKVKWRTFLFCFLDLLLQFSYLLFVEILVFINLLLYIVYSILSVLPLLLKLCCLMRDNCFRLRKPSLQHDNFVRLTICLVLIFIR
jgi:hypothetical protein